MASKRARARHLATWRNYRNRCDRLVQGQPLTRAVRHPMRTTAGFFRAEGWDTRGIHRRELGHGA